VNHPVYIYISELVINKLFNIIAELELVFICCLFVLRQFTTFFEYFSTRILPMRLVRIRIQRKIILCQHQFYACTSTRREPSSALMRATCLIAKSTNVSHYLLLFLSICVTQCCRTFLCTRAQFTDAYGGAGATILLLPPPPPPPLNTHYSYY
jgi:hypothetical protein